MNTQEISGLLQKIRSVIDNPAFPAVSQLERDLLMQHIRDFYDKTGQAIHGAQTETAATTVKKEIVEETTVLIKRPVMRANDNLLLNQEQPVHESTGPVKQEPAANTETMIEPAVQKVAAVQQTQPEPVIEKGPEKTVQVQPSINETIKTGGSLNEKLKASSVVEMHKKFATKPLKELIDLNKKFVLLNELFKGNADAYTAAITHIDTLPHYEAAQTFISTQLVTSYSWDESRQSTRMFSKLVKTRFGVE